MRYRICIIMLVFLLLAPQVPLIAEYEDVFSSPSSRPSYTSTSMRGGLTTVVRSGGYLPSRTFRIDAYVSWTNGSLFDEHWLVGPGREAIGVVTNDMIYVASDEGIMILNPQGSKNTSIHMPSLIDIESYDIDSDGDLEILVANSTRVALVNTSGTYGFLSTNSILDIAVGDMCDDPGAEIALAREDGVALFSSQGVEEWFYPLANTSTINCIDWDDDKFEEILVVTRHTVTVLDGDSSPLWSYTLSDPIVMVQVGDIDGGPEDVAICAGQGLYLVFNGGNSILQRNLTEEPTSICMADIDGLPGSEIVLGFPSGQIYAYNMSLLAVLHASVPKPIYSIQGLNLDADSPDELVAGCWNLVVAVDNNGTELWNTTCIGNISILVPVGSGIIACGVSPWIYYIDEGSMVWRNRILGNPLVTLEANIVGGAEAEQVVIFNDSTLSIFDRDGDEISTKNLTSVPLQALRVPGLWRDYLSLVFKNGTVALINGTEVSWRVQYGYEPTVADVADLDGDGVSEIIVGGKNGTLALGTNGSIMWRIYGFNVTSLTTGDVDVSAGKECLCGLNNGTLLIQASNGSVLRLLNVASESISHVVIAGDRIIYSHGSTLGALSTVTYVEEWSHVLGGEISSLTRGRIIGSEAVVYLTSSSLGAILANGSKIFERNDTDIESIAVAHVNGSGDQIIAWNRTMVAIYDCECSVMLLGTPMWGPHGITPIDLDDDGINEIALCCELGAIMCTPVRFLWIYGPKNGSVFSNSTVNVSYGFFGFDVSEFLIYANDSLLMHTSSTSVVVEIPGDGKWVIRVIAIPKSGSSVSSNVSIIVDTRPPLVSVSAPPNASYLSERNVTIVWGGDDSVSGIEVFELYVNGRLEYRGEDTNYTTMLDYGSNNICVVAHDFAGNSNRSISLVVVDDKNPMFVGANISNGSHIALKDVAVEWLYVEDYLDHFEVCVDGGEWVDVGTNNTYLLTNMSNGNHSMRVKALDRAGNVGYMVIEFCVDYVAPRVEVLTPKNFSFQNGTIILLSYTIYEENLASVHIYVDGSLMVSDTPANSTVELSLQEGWHNITILAADLAGNTNRSIIMLCVDISRPRISILFPSNSSYHKMSNVSVSWIADDDVSEIAKVLMRVDNYAWFELSDRGNVTLPLDDGKHSIYLRAIDMAGNNAICVIIIYVDTGPPRISILGPQNNSLVNSSLISISIEVLDASPSTVSVLLNGSEISNGTGPISLDIFLTDGVWVIDIIATDVAGNTASATILLRIDTTQPQICILSPRNGSKITNESMRVLWQSWDESGVEYFLVRIDNGSWRYVGNRTWYIIETLSLSEGSHVFCVAAFDVAGNRATSTLVFIVSRRVEIPVGKRMMLPILAFLVFILAIASYIAVEKIYARRTG